MTTNGARPSSVTPEWTRRYLALLGIEHPAPSLENLTRLVRATPALCARQLEKQHGWRPGLAQALAERAGADTAGIAHWARASAALDCLNVAVDHWSDAGGTLDLIDLLDEAFAALT